MAASRVQPVRTAGKHMGSFFNNLKAVGDQFTNHDTDATKIPTNALETGAYGGNAPSLAAAQAGYPTAYTSGPGAPLLTGGGSGTLHGAFNNLTNMNLGSGGTNYYAAPVPTVPSSTVPGSAIMPAAAGAAAAATPQSYVQQAGRMQGTALTNRNGY